MAVKYDVSEQEQLIVIFSKMLRQPTEDGGRKRAAGLKPSWKVDETHEEHFWNHIAAWKRGELHDPDSNAHPGIHAAWRLLAIAYQDTQAEENEEKYTEYEVIK